MTRQTGTTADVLAAFVAGRSLRTRTAGVPGGCRATSQNDARGTVLYSYRTEQAIRRPDGSIEVTLQLYSVTTSKLVGHLRGALARAGYSLVRVSPAAFYANVPGRHGGYGIPWHATGTALVAADVYERGAL